MASVSLQYHSTEDLEKALLFFFGSNEVLAPVRFFHCLLYCHEGTPDLNISRSFSRLKKLLYLLLKPQSMFVTRPRFDRSRCSFTSLFVIANLAPIEHLPVKLLVRQRAQLYNSFVDCLMALQREAPGFVPEATACLCRFS